MSVILKLKAKNPKQSGRVNLYLRFFATLQNDEKSFLKALKLFLKTHAALFKNISAHTSLLCNVMRRR
jgi:hypothetical protein